MPGLSRGIGEQTSRLQASESVDTTTLEISVSWVLLLCPWDEDSRYDLGGRHAVSLLVLPGQRAIAVVPWLEE